MLVGLNRGLRHFGHRPRPCELRRDLSPQQPLRRHGARGERRLDRGQRLARGAIGRVGDGDERAQIKILLAHDGERVAERGGERVRVKTRYRLRGEQGDIVALRVGGHGVP